MMAVSYSHKLEQKCVYVIFPEHQKCARTVAWYTAEKYINELAKEGSSERAQNEWQVALNTILSRHRCRSGTT